MPAEVVADLLPELAGSCLYGSSYRVFRLAVASLWWYAFLYESGQIWPTAADRQTLEANIALLCPWGVQRGMIFAVGW